MRRYDDPIEVRKGLVSGREAPEQFVWRDRLWVVRTVLAHWVETGAWWRQAQAAALLGGGDAHDGSASVGGDMLAEQEVWRVEAARGRQVRSGWGVFDLAYAWGSSAWGSIDWGDSSWRLVNSLD